MIKNKTKNLLIALLLLTVGLFLIFDPKFPEKIFPYRHLIGLLALYRAWLAYKKIK